MLLWIDCFSFVSGSLTSLISNCLSLLFGTQGRPRRLKLLLQTRNGGHGGAFVPRRALQGPARFQCVMPLCVWCVHVCGGHVLGPDGVPSCALWPICPSVHGLWPCSRVRKLKGRALQPLPSPLPSQTNPLGLTGGLGRRSWTRVGSAPAHTGAWDLPSLSSLRVGAPQQG